MILDSKYIVVKKENLDDAIMLLETFGYKISSEFQNGIGQFLNGPRVKSHFIYSESYLLFGGVFEGGNEPGDFHMKRVFPELKRVNIYSIIREEKLKRILK